ncbi:MAG: FAD-dependent oxidoreductase [Sedimentisphaerales bacterium]|jgi:NADPH-dependent glutamate synthase beta subunit-like oxidoreductase/2,4-dienoyl-CoA reductase-like NADH-dependent reductase (Old Yellow Enzyme family)
MFEFYLEKIKDLRKLAALLSLDVPMQEDVSILGQALKTGVLTAPNRMAVNPMEGADGDSEGNPGELTLRRYKRFAAGGCGIIWAEAIAVVPEGRANPRQLWLHDGSKDAFANMVAEMRKAAKDSMGSQHRPIIVAQLTHSGRYSKPEGVSKPIIPQRDPYRDAMIPQQKPEIAVVHGLEARATLATDDYLDGLVEAYVKAAKLAFEAGFDAVDIKACHGYLINELLACHNREGRYGGSFENRTLLLLAIIDAIHQKLGKDKAVVTRLGIYDAIPYPYGWGVDKNDYTKPDLAEPKKLFTLLSQRNIPMINVTIGNPYYNPHFNRPFNEPIAGGYESPENPLAGVERMIRLTGEMQKAFPNIVLVGPGYSWLRHLLPYVGAAVLKNGMASIIGAGRMSFAYPDFAKDILTNGKLDPNKVCIACSACTQIMRDGGTTGCVVRDNKVYGPIYKHGRMSNRDNLMRLAQHCRKCEQPSCRCACPAGVNIPKFISLFLEGKDKEAYEAIRKSNVFPEICAWLCPVEAQCEGSCLQKYIGDGPLPIAEIQRYLAEQANKNGWSKLNIPSKLSGKRVAIIGAGPAGLSCAARLLEAGHEVTVFDKNKLPGGMVESAIPADRIGAALTSEVKAIFDGVPAQRFKIESGKELNTGFTLESVMSGGFDACFIGLGLSKVISSSETKADGIWDAIEFLNIAKKGKLDLGGKRVAVIGGGNTAMDAACTAKRLGARDVYVIYRRSFGEMPAWPGELERAMDAGIHFLILTQQLEYETRDRKLTAIKLCPTELGEPDKSGRRKPVALKDITYVLDFDAVVEAIGQESPEDIGKALCGIDMTDGLIKINEHFQTSKPNIFAGGDIVHGASTVVGAVSDGMKAAEQINHFLEGKA